MIAALRRRAAGLVEVVPSEAARAAGTEGMVFAEVEAGAAAELMGPAAHAEAAEALVPALEELVPRAA
ncbi:hypothetical protein Salmuc_04092 [Salipiger mucosus DSM 16094]|uniref:DUF6473 domain-containing protein n=2 Tax=Salipiger mucosus TaxID=263378 RepID=S9QRV0_9RHOB|nr:hypothetical protein Salmuc_04092 [Salipiger mucosus DSM 16094]